MKRYLSYCIMGALIAVPTGAVRVGAQQGVAGADGAATAGAATPRTPDGKPDITGVWSGGGGGFGAQVDERGNITIGAGRGREGTLTNFERDSGLAQRAVVNRPWYKPQHWARVQYYDYNGNTEDPEFLCFPAGVPRMGQPAKIVNNNGAELLFLYDQRNTFRTIYMDGRPHPPEDKWEGRWYGHSVGHWEGDTLVIDSVDFTDASWLGWPGWIHSDNMRVEERMSREGNTLRWEATVFDPDVLLKPWTMNPEIRQLNPDPKAELPEDLPCSERDSKHIVTKERG